MKSAATRFQALWEVLEPPNPKGIPAPSDMREQLMTAYGFPRGDQGIDNSRESAEEERNFAMACLRGEGGTEGQFLWESNNLTSVLASEIGLLPPPADNDSPMRPWFGGDWASMAELVIYIADNQLSSITRPFGRTPTELIRVYPIEWDTAARTQLNLLEARIKLGTRGHKDILLQNKDAKKLGHGQPSRKPTESEWISLCVPFDNLYLISNQLPEGPQSGIPANLWDFIPSGEPGDEVT